MTPLFNPRGPEVYYPGMPCNPPTPSAVDYLKQEIEEIKSQLGDSTIPHVVVLNTDALPAEGSEHVVYITTEDNKVFRWAGSEYSVISDIKQTSDNFDLIARHINTVKGNPHKVTKADIGLSNVDNTSDNDKPVSKKQLAAIELEAASRYAQYQSLQKDFNGKITSLTDADIALGTRIDTEVTNRTTADSTLQKNIDSEATTRAKTDKTLQANIDAEASARSSADSKLRDDLATETSKRESADTTLQSNLSKEISRAKDAEEANTASITTEITRAKNAEEANASAINAEVTRAKNAESEINTALATKADLVEGVVPASQLPSYVDDVLEFASVAKFPAEGERGKIYVATDTNLTYRWSGSQYVEISQSLALGETAATAYAGDKGKKVTDALAAHKKDTANPHAVTAAQVGAYTKAEVDEKIEGAGKVKSVNGKEGVVVLTAEDIGALPATKDETTDEYNVTDSTVFKKKVTIEVGDEDSDESTESDTGIGICAFDSTTERGVEVFDASSNKSSALVPDGTRFVTMGTIKEAAYQFPTFSNDDTIKTIIAKLQQIITLLQGIGD